MVIVKAIEAQRAIDYMEEHILEDMKVEDIAAQSFSSSYHFQRVFSIVCGMTIGEHIRNRRNKGKAMVSDGRGMRAGQLLPRHERG